MAVFEYQAVDNSGKKKRGIIDADSPAEARAKLHQEGLHLTSLKESLSSSIPSREIKIFRKVRIRDLALLTRQLATLLVAGLPLTEALSGVSEQLENQTLKKAMVDIRERVKSGSTLSSALSQYPKIFSDLYVDMIRAGESAGALELVLERLADYNEKHLHLENRIRAALAYPLFIVAIGILVLSFLFAFVVPRVTSLFTTFQASLPRPTIILIALGNFFKGYWWLLLLLVVALIFGIKRYIKTEGGGKIFDRLKLKVPLFGSLNQRIALAMFSRTLATLLAGGVPLLGSLEIVKNIVGNRVIAKAIREAGESVRRGESLAASLSRSKVFPSIVVRMIASGEKSGNLENLLYKAADTYDSEVEATVGTLTALLEPVLILLMGLVVGFIVLAILLPIFEMSQAIR
jgi:general secretion pathway protein F